MRTRTFVLLSVSVVALTFAAAPALAQTEARPGEHGSTTPVEVTPFVSLGSSASSRVGGAVTFPWTATLSVEGEVGYRRAELNALSSSVNLLYWLPRVGRVAPYLATGVGLEQYATAVAGPTTSLVIQPRTALTINAGGGVKVPANDRWGFRTDARWFNGLGQTAPEHWRLYNGVSINAGKP